MSLFLSCSPFLTGFPLPSSLMHIYNLQSIRTFCYSQRLKQSECQVRNYSTLPLLYSSTTLLFHYSTLPLLYSSTILLSPLMLHSLSAQLAFNGVRSAKEGQYHEAAPLNGSKACSTHGWKSNVPNKIGELTNKKRYL